MAAGISLVKSAAGDVPTPASGKVTVFVDSTSGEPSYKDDAGTAASLKGAQGDAGPTGAAGADGADGRSGTARYTYKENGAIGAANGEVSFDSGILSLGEDDADGASVSGWLLEVGDSTNTSKGYFSLLEVGGTDKVVYEVTSGSALGVGGLNNYVYFSVTLISGTPVVDAVYDVNFSATGDKGADGAGAWGSITGTLSDQTDLQAALDGKQATITGLTASGAELNILDGATLTTTELNYVDGVTSAIQTQIDGKLPTTVTTKGDLIGFSTVPTRVAIGTDGYVLTADAASAAGFKWAAASGGGGGGGDVYLANTQTFTGVNTYKNNIVMQTSGGTQYGKFDAANSRLILGEDVGYGGGQLLVGSAAGTSGIAMGQSASSNFAMFTGANGDTDIRTYNYFGYVKVDASIVQFQSKNSNNVAIGNVTPTEKLEVAGNVKATEFKGGGANLTGIPQFSTTNTFTGTNSFRTINIHDSGGTIVGGWDSSSKRFSLGTSSFSNWFSLGDDIGASYGGNGLVVGNTAGSCAVTTGQGSANKLQVGWIYNANAALAGASIVTYGYSNPIAIDASAIKLQTTSNGSVTVGSTTSTVGFFGATPVSKPAALTAANAGTLNTGDATSDTIIANMRTRINELESKLQALGLLS